MSWTKDIPLWATAVGLGGFMVELVRGYIQRRKLGGDYAQAMASASVQLLAPFQQAVNELQADLTEARESERKLRTDLEETSQALAAERRTVGLLRAELAEAVTEVEQLKALLSKTRAEEERNGEQ